MSMTYSLVCHDCKEEYWAGQSGDVYDGALLGKFLYRHEDHSLQFSSDAYFGDKTVGYSYFEQLIKG